MGSWPRDHNYSANLQKTLSKDVNEAILTIPGAGQRIPTETFLQNRILNTMSTKAIGSLHGKSNQATTSIMMKEDP